MFSNSVHSCCKGMNCTYTLPWILQAHHLALEITQMRKKRILFYVINCNVSLCIEYSSVVDTCLIYIWSNSYFSTTIFYIYQVSIVSLYYVILFNLNIVAHFADFRFIKEVIKWIFVCLKIEISETSQNVFIIFLQALYTWTSILSNDNDNKIKIKINSENADNFVHSALSNI